MKIISGIFGFAVLALVLCFALSNQQSIDLKFWPMDGVVSLPLYMVGLVPLTAGLVVGGVMAWLGSIPHRLKARRLHKEITMLNDRIGDLQKTAVIMQEPERVRTSFWKKP